MECGRFTPRQLKGMWARFQVLGEGRKTKVLRLSTSRQKGIWKQSPFPYLTIRFHHRNAFLIFAYVVSAVALKRVVSVVVVTVVVVLVPMLTGY